MNIDIVNYSKKSNEPMLIWGYIIICYNVRFCHGVMSVNFFYHDLELQRKPENENILKILQISRKYKKNLVHLPPHQQDIKRSDKLDTNNMLKCY